MCGHRWEVQGGKTSPWKKVGPVSPPHPLGQDQRTQGGHTDSERKGSPSLNMWSREGVRTSPITVDNPRAVTEPDRNLSRRRETRSKASPQMLFLPKESVVTSQEGIPNRRRLSLDLGPNEGHRPDRAWPAETCPGHAGGWRSHRGATGRLVVRILFRLQMGDFSWCPHGALPGVSPVRAVTPCMGPPKSPPPNSTRDRAFTV